MMNRVSYAMLSFCRCSIYSIREFIEIGGIILCFLPLVGLK